MVVFIAGFRAFCNFFQGLPFKYGCVELVCVCVFCVGLCCWLWCILGNSVCFVILCLKILSIFVILCGLQQHTYGLSNVGYIKKLDIIRMLIVCGVAE